jgi:hypothetical protein
VEVLIAGSHRGGTKRKAVEKQKAASYYVTFIDRRSEAFVALAPACAIGERTE